MNGVPRRLHQDICRRLANALEAACGGAFAVSTDVDLRLRDVPLRWWSKSCHRAR